MAHRAPRPETPEQQSMASMRGSLFHYELTFEGKRYLITTEYGLPFGRERDALLEMARSGRFFENKPPSETRPFTTNSPAPIVTVTMAEGQPGAKEWNAQPSMARTDILQSQLAIAVERGTIAPIRSEEHTSELQS